MEELRGVEEKWRLIGEGLGQGVDDITYPDPTDCLRKIVRKWLQSPYLMFNPHTWGLIVLALRNAGEPQLEDNLKAKYLPGELTTTPSSQYLLESQHGENEMM